MNRYSDTSTAPRGPDAVKDLAAAWIARRDAGLTHAEEEELKAWIEADPRHGAALGRLDAVWHTFDRPHAAGLSDELERELAEHARRRQQKRRRGAAVSLGLVMLIGLGVFWQLNERHLKGWFRPAARAVMVLPERRVLADGSVVELKDGAEIAADFGGVDRRVALRRGEAHFQVAQDAARPFVVVAGDVEIKAVGTAFTVGINPGAVQVLVTEGRVVVGATERNTSEAAPRLQEELEKNRTSSGATQDSALATHGAGSMVAPSSSHALVVPTYVDAGESIAVPVVSNGTNATDASRQPPAVVAVRPAEREERLAWRAPRVEFTRVSLAEAVALLNAHAAKRRGAGFSGTGFVIDDPDLADVRVSGLFRVDNTEAFVQLLKNGFGIEAEQRGSEEIALRRGK